MNPEPSAAPEDPRTVKLPAPAEGRPARASVSGGANPDASVPYEFRQEIARGGMGSILEAQDRKLGRTVAVKIMLSEMGADADQRQRFINEAAVLARLAHPNIVPVYDIGRDAEGQLFYTMKLVHGRTLQAILNGVRDGDTEAQHYTLDRLLTVFRKVCDALAFAHSRGIIHRDLKPENVMVGEFGEVLVMDWGLAKQTRSEEPPTPRPVTARTVGEETAVMNAPDGFGGRGALGRFLAKKAGADSGMTLEGEIMGTPQYMSPEQAAGRIAEMDARSDIFSLGGILYAILTLRPPVEGSTLDEVLHKVASGSITAPSALSTGTGTGTPGATGGVLEARKIKPLPHCPGGRVPAALSSVVMKALCVKREDRYQNVAALSTDVESFQNGFATGAENAGAWKLFTLFVKRNKAASIGVAAVLLIGGTLGTKALIEGRRAEQAITALKASAPDLVRLAATDANAQNYAAAEKNIAAARALDPELRELYWQHTWNLIGMEDYPGAATAFREAIRRDPTRTDRASAFRFIEQMAAARTPEERSDSGALTQLATLLREAGATGPASVLLGKLGGRSPERLALVRARLGSLLAKDQFSVNASTTGYLYVTLKPGAVTDLEIVRGLPIDMLEIEYGKMTSLEPLRGMRLTLLIVSLSPVSDLSPLQGMALTQLWLHATKVSDLRPLAGMPLTSFAGSAEGIVDLEPLRGAPISYLSIYNSRVADLGPVAGAPLKKVEARGTRVSDLTPLIGAPIETIEIGATSVTDLTPLRGMPLVTLKIDSLPLLTDLSPLRGLGLKHLTLDYSRKITDFSPLLDLPKIETISCAGLPAALAVLRQHPTLKAIGYRLPGEDKTIVRPVAEFWKLYDAQPAATKK